MKTIALKESTVLLEVRRIKEQIAQEALTDPGYYQRLNGQGALLLAPYRKFLAAGTLSEENKKLPKPPSS